MDWPRVGEPPTFFPLLADGFSVPNSRDTIEEQNLLPLRALLFHLANSVNHLPSVDNHLAEKPYTTKILRESGANFTFRDCLYIVSGCIAK